jgi:hypothetical protein
MKNLIACLLVTWLLCSCTSTQKNKTSHQVKTDSTAESSVVKSGISTSSSNELHQGDSSFQNEFSIEFGEEDQPGDTGNPSDAVQQANDLIGTVQSVKLHLININGKNISSSKSIKSITIKEAGQSKKIDLQQQQKKDSGQSWEQSDIMVKKFEQDKEKIVHRSGANYLITISLAIILIAAAGISWKFGLFTRKKKTVSDTFNNI